MYDSREIQAIIPHRYPFLLVDRVLEIVPGDKIVAVKCVSGNEPFFAGHFPGDPIMPGVLIIEALAQAGAVLLYNEREKAGLFMLAGVDKARFRRPVVPGDQLMLEVELKRARGTMGRARGRATVDEQIVAECDIIFALVST